MRTLIQKPVNTCIPRGKKADYEAGLVSLQKRIWIEGRKVLNYFENGSLLKITDHADQIIIEAVDSRDDENAQYRSVSARKGNVGLIEINECNSEVLKGMKEDQLLRIVMDKGRVKVSIVKDTLQDRIEERNERVKTKVANGETLVKCSIFAGGGTFDYSAHEGFKKSGLSTVVRMALDFESDCTDNLLANVSHAFDEKSILIEADIANLNVWNMGEFKCDIMILTPPCVDASAAGKAKKGNKFETSKTSHLVFHYAKMIEKFNPAIILLENVKGYKKEVSYNLLVPLLESFGYNVQDRIIHAKNDGFSLETRERMFMYAESIGLETGFELTNVTPILPVQKTLGECLIDVAADDNCWKAKTGLIEKQARDQEKGNGFAMQIYNKESDKIGTLRAQYLKSGSSDPLLKNETNDTFRLLEPVEHCNVKNIDTALIDGIEAKGVAHGILGNGIDGNVAQSICYHLGTALISKFQGKAVKRAA